MVSIRHLILSAAILGGVEAAALACVDMGEEARIAYSDAVIDGVVTCDTERGRCVLRARNVVKQHEERTSSSRIYRFRYDPRANERFHRQQAESGQFWMCIVPWEPREARFEGRFYLDWRRGAYQVRQDSSRGRHSEEFEDEDEDAAE